MAYSTESKRTRISSPIANGFCQLSARFQDPMECLAAYLMLESSEVLAGIKPANLVSLVNRPRSCGRNLYQIWCSHHNELTSRFGGISFRVLQSRDRALLLLCYQAQQLEQHLSHSGIRSILARAGYDITLNSLALLNELCSRMENSESFPHEIGLFIGYPAKDVAAFMGMVNLPFTCQGPWKIYGEASRSLCLADAFRRTRQKMCSQLAMCSSPYECLDQPESAASIFLHPY